MNEIIDRLNGGDKASRLSALRELKALMDNGSIDAPARGTDVNNHIHTCYSFSPYSPSKAAYMAYMSGLATAGIMDHDSISGAQEFIEAGKILGLAITCGIECRVRMEGTPLYGRRINNPDQDSVAYIALHGVPHTQIDKVCEFFAPYRQARNVRNRKMTERLCEILSPYGISLDFERDVVALSYSQEGGSITERHILFALSHKIISRFGKGTAVAAFIENDMGIAIPDKIKALLTDDNNPYYDYDLLGVLKGNMVEKFYIDAYDECPHVSDVLKLSNEIGAISAYAYLGDVGDSVTGDKKTQKFEDGYIELLFDTIKSLGFNAVTYMPSRNTKAQLDKIRTLANTHSLFQISGEDINTPRQSFICEAMRDPSFSNLIDAAWALIGHERAATLNLEDSMFSDKTIKKYPNLDERIRVYNKIRLNV